MPREIPYRWLIAETLAWPLVSEAAFGLQTVALERSAVGLLGEETRGLAERLDGWLRPRAGGWSLGALRALRERCWFDLGDRRVPLGEYVARVAADRLVFSGARVMLQTGPASASRSSGGPLAAELSYPERLGRWHWLCRALPAELLIAALGARDAIEPMSDTVDLGSCDISRLLEREVAETHLHVGAAITFPALWAGLMRAADRLDPAHRKAPQGESTPFGGADTFVATLRAAAIARIWMGLFLYWRSDRSGDEPFIGFFHGDPGTRIARRSLWPEGAAAFVRAARRGFRFLTAWPGRTTHARRALAEMRSVLVHFALLCQPDRGGDSRQRTDFVDWLWPARPGSPGVETRFGYRCLRYLLGAGREDIDFARLFWQYQRVRCQVFRHVVQEPGTRGLDWFGEHYQRISWLRSPARDERYRIALDTDSRGVRLASFEARTSPERTWEKTWREVRAYAAQGAGWLAASPDRGSTEMGLVLHFVKKRRCRCGRLHADPRHVAFPARYGAWFHDARIEAESVARMLAYAPECLLLLRGVDVANAELAVPTWVTIPLLHRVRSASDDAARRLARRYPRTNQRPIERLRTTYHAGEEFRTLHEGLRRVHELVEFGGLDQADRIGHGLVLGMDVDEWLRTRSYALQPAEDRLDDLLWEWERYARDHISPPPGREAAIRDQVARLGRAIYSTPASSHSPSLESLIEARRLRHDPTSLAALGYPRCRPHSPRSVERRLLWRYLTDPEVFERGQQPLEIHVGDPERDAIRELQARLRAMIGSRAITIESNPTSNLVIGDMVDITRHPSFVIQPVDRRGEIPLSVNTDNPLTFSTCLADEYTYLYGAMLDRGVAASEACAWLERARQAGWDSRFTRPETSHPGTLQIIENALTVR